MKKLLIIFMALTLASAAFATATYEITITGSGSGTNVYAGDTVRVTFDETAADSGGLGDFKTNVDRYADIPSPEVKWLYDFDMLDSIAISVNGDGIDVLCTGQNFGDSPTGDVFYFEFEVASDAVVSNKITISHSSGNWNGDYSPDVASDVQLTVMPEPMTIALLGLGGLFLRRRK